MKLHELKEFLDEKSDFYNNPAFIESDPICIPHRFEKKEDIEISGFLTATIAWGNRKSIIRNAATMMALMDNAPYDFVMNHKPHHLERFNRFVHRTFNQTDLEYFVKALQNIYRHEGGPEMIFARNISGESVLPAIAAFRDIFFSLPCEQRTAKHVSDPRKGSVAKRINMFLRWMVRRDNRGVDFGLWHSVPASVLSCPLDVHSGNVARKLGLITRKQNDTMALAELDHYLRQMDPDDPAKYDFALFGLGVFEKF